MNAAHVDISRIEEVDYIIGGSSLADTIGQAGRYDYIVASHVIEHQPDMLGFLKDCETLLRPSGVLLLVVPDKRHCFDMFQPLTSTGQFIQAHLDGRTQPGLGTIFDDRAYNAVRDESIGWTSDAVGKLRFFLCSKQAAAAFDQDQRSKHYIDVHVWKFVPSSFRLIINDLNLFGYMELRENSFFDSVGNEFYITLSRNGEGSGVDRMTLAKPMLTEHASIVLEES